MQYIYRGNENKSEWFCLLFSNVLILIWLNVHCLNFNCKKIVENSTESHGFASRNVCDVDGK